jgi:hypothetical protein
MPLDLSVVTVAMALSSASMPRAEVCCRAWWEVRLPQASRIFYTPSLIRRSGEMLCSPGRSIRHARPARFLLSDLRCFKTMIGWPRRREENQRSAWKNARSRVLLTCRLGPDAATVPGRSSECLQPPNFYEEGRYHALHGYSLGNSVASSSRHRLSVGSGW